MKKTIKQTGKKDKIKAILADEKKITETLKRAVREAILAHQRAGNPIAIWKNGKAVWVKAE